MPHLPAEAAIAHRNSEKYADKMNFQKQAAHRFLVNKSGFDVRRAAERLFTWLLVY